MKPHLRDHCHERPPVLTDHTFLVGPTFQYNLTCHQTPPVLTDHIFVANGVAFQDRFYCTIIEAGIDPYQLMVHVLKEMFQNRLLVTTSNSRNVSG